MKIHDFGAFISAFCLLILTQAGEKERNRRSKFSEYDNMSCNPDKQDCDAALRCGDGMYPNDQGICVECQKNCEKCTCIDCCYQCAPGFYLVSDQVNNGKCVTQLPRGYLPDLTSFEYINQDLIKTSELQKKTTSCIAIAYEHKRVVCSNRELPYTADDNGQPVFDGTKVRVKAYPCVLNCKVCPDGYLKNAQNNKCEEGFVCPWPLTEKKADDGEPICVDLTPDEFKATIMEKSKKVLTELEKKAKELKDLKKKRKRGPGHKIKDKKKKNKEGKRSLKAITNKDGNPGIQLNYEWTILKINDDGNLGSVHSETLFQHQSTHSRKFKILKGDLQVGKYRVKCEVSDGHSTVYPEIDIEIDERTGTPAND